jgi:hypothetical protein
MGKGIAFIGDIAYSGIISSQPWKNNERYLEINGLLESFDFVFANLEVPVNNGSLGNNCKKINYSSDPDVTKRLLMDHNIGCVSLANNHIYDYTMGGLRSTIELLDRLNIYHTGAGWEPSHIEPVIIEIGEEKYAFMAYVDKSTNPGTEGFTELLINYFDLHRVKEDVGKIRQKVDHVICSIHWGNDYSFFPTERQVKDAHELADSGVDLIMGHHTHTIQPIEHYKNSWIFYSLGGLTYGDDYINGRLRSLKKRTKSSFIPVFSDIKSRPELISTRELEGNIVTIDERDIWRWSGRRWRWVKISHKYTFLRLIIIFHERVTVRLYDFLFGYYSSSLPQVLLTTTKNRFKKLFCQ